MSQFGGGKPGGWGRPAPTGGQMPNFSAMNVGGFPMVGMGVPMGMVNQAAFSQPNMMGMQGIMGAVSQQQLAPQAQPVRAPPQQQGSNGMPAAQGAKNRTFVGVVTKMLDNYGFVDDDVFFQHNVIRGAHPRTGDKVMVEANYNPGMPFKWNAFRIQLLNAVPAQNEPPPVNPVRAPPQRPTNEQTRWGPGSVNDRISDGRLPSPPRGGSRRSTPPRRVSPRRQLSPKRDIPVRPVRRSPRRSPHRRSPPRVERNDRKRERSPGTGSGSVAASVRRDSASPPRRRARIIPRYECRLPKQTLLNAAVSGTTIRSRYTKLYIPSDFVDLSFEWVANVPLDTPIDYTNPIQFHVFHKDVDYPAVEGAEEAVLEPEDADNRHQVKVLLLSHGGKQEIVKKSFCLLADGSSDDHQEPQSIFKNLSFLVGSRGKEIMGIGGSWSPSLDGQDPTSPATLIRTAVRTTKALTGIDLSAVPQWYSMVQVRYYRSDKERVDRVHLLWPDTQLLLPEDDMWDSLQAALGEQLKAKIATIDALNVVEPTSNAPAQAVDSVVPPKEEENSASPVIANVADVANVSDVKMEDEDEDDEPEVKPTPTHWSNIDPKGMKVAELRQELEARGLETKGIKTLLVQRLQTALDAEVQQEESDTTVAANDVDMKEAVNGDEKPADKDSATAVAPATTENAQAATKTEAEQKKEAEEMQKKIEKADKEKKEKCDALEKHFTMPKEKKVLVFPSKTAKQGKFDCKVVSLHSLLEYRIDDNKEAQFEVSLFAEAFRELVDRYASFGVYASLVNSEDKESERKKRDEARGKVPEKKDDEKKEDSKDEKKEDVKVEKTEKIELKSIVSNRACFEAFALFDQNLCGYLMERDVEEILYMGEFGISRGQIQKLTKKLSVRDKVNYRHLTDVLVDSDGVVKFTPGQLEEPVELALLNKGYGLALTKSLDQDVTNGTECTASSDGNVVINGNVVNVPLKLKLLRTMEIERDAAKSSLSENLSLIDQLRESKAEIEKKKKDIEKDFEKAKKKATDIGNILKITTEENVNLKTLLSDCRKYADRVVASIDKTLSPPTKKEASTPSKEKEKVEKTDKDGKGTPVEENEPIVAEMVLTEEVGPEEEEDKKEAS